MNDFIKEIGMAILWMFLGYLLGECSSARESQQTTDTSSSTAKQQLHRK